MQRAFLTKIHWCLAALLAVLCAVSLWVNLPSQTTSFGTMDGQYDDAVDSFSEYIVRNTVIHRYHSGHAAGASLLVTRGYPHNFEYDPVDLQSYYSNRAIQTAPYTHAALFLDTAFLENPDAFFQALRLLNCLLLSALVFAFFFALLNGTLTSVLIPLIFVHTSGIVLFSANLYVQTWGMFLPLAGLLFLKRGWVLGYIGFSFLTALLYFSIRYEFATAFTFMFLLPVLLTCEGPTCRKICAATFCAVCAGFAVALALHHMSLAHHLETTWLGASSEIFGSVNKRMMSFTDVPLPFSTGFFAEIDARWDWPGLGVGSTFAIPKSLFLAALCITAAVFRRGPEMTLVVWALFAYVSWYVVGYQHIMWHIQYDSFLFAATIQLSLAVIWGQRLMQFADCRSERAEIHRGSVGTLSGQG